MLLAVPAHIAPCSVRRKPVEFDKERHVTSRTMRRAGPTARLPLNCSVPARNVRDHGTRIADRKEHLFARRFE
jgi:hypothetical protein